MTATEIRDEIARRGGRLDVQVDRLLVRPGRVLDDRLRQAIRERKTELIALVGTAAAGRDGTPAGWDWMVQMPRALFEAGRYIVWLHSEILGEQIALVSRPDLVARVRAVGCVAYLPAEIDRLAAHPLDAETLRKLHAIKRQIDGTVTGCSGPASGRQHGA